MNVQIFEMKMPQLEKTRTVRVYLPNGYEENNQQAYPVLYMHDGQNLFDAATAGYGVHWEVGEAIEALQQDGESDGIIVVGIDNAEGTERFDEYSPWENHNLLNQIGFGPESGFVGGQGAAYAQFIVETLKPYIDETYRTKREREHTAVAGSSMGGMISLYTGLQHSDVFSKIGAFSTAAWFAADELYAFIEEVFGKHDMKIYVDAGTDEGHAQRDIDLQKAYIEDAQKLHETFLRLGQPKEQLMLVIDEGAKHHESDWARRFPAFLRWMNM